MNRRPLQVLVLRRYPQNQCPFSQVLSNESQKVSEGGKARKKPFKDSYYQRMRLQSPVVVQVGPRCRPQGQQPLRRQPLAEKSC